MTIRQLLSHPLVIILISLGAGAFYVSLAKTSQNIRTSAETVVVLDQEVSQIASEVSQLEHDVQQATSANTLDLLIRNELLMQKPGEFVVQIANLDQDQQPGVISSETKTPWEEWMELLTK